MDSVTIQLYYNFEVKSKINCMESNLYERMLHKVREVNGMLGGEAFGFKKDGKGQWEILVGDREDRLIKLKEWEVFRLVDIIDYEYQIKKGNVNRELYRIEAKNSVIKFENIWREYRYKYEDVCGIKQEALIKAGWRKEGFDTWCKGEDRYEGVYVAYNKVFGNERKDKVVEGNQRVALDKVGKGIFEAITRKEKEEDEKLVEVLKERQACPFKGNEEKWEDKLGEAVNSVNWQEFRIDKEDMKNYKVEIRWRGDKEDVIKVEACTIRDKEGKEIDLVSNEGLRKYNEWLIERINKINKEIYGGKKEEDGFTVDKERVEEKDGIIKEIEEALGKLSDEAIIEMIGEVRFMLDKKGKVVVDERAPQKKKDAVIFVTEDRLKEAIEEEEGIRFKQIVELNDKINKNSEKIGKIEESIGNIFKLIEKARELINNVEKVMKGRINVVATDLNKLDDKITGQELVIRKNRDEIFSIVGNEGAKKEKAINGLEDKIRRLEEAFNILRLAVEGRQGEASDKLYSNILNSKKE